jgi:uncharacterized membrane protein
MEEAMAKTVAELAGRWLKRQPEALSEQENRVLESAVARKPISRDVNVAVAHGQGFGDRLADAIARIGGSWSFIVTAVIFLVLWTSGNAWLLGREGFDPYPFIFLNLVLSMVAALQAPIIMMSQNRQAARDRFEASKDYEVNLKAEIELMALHHKIDTHFLDEIAALKLEVVRLHEALRQKE